MPDTQIDLSDFITIKGITAIGNQLTKLKTKQIDLLEQKEEDLWPIEVDDLEDSTVKEGNNSSEEDEDGQHTLFDEDK